MKQKVLLLLLLLLLFFFLSSLFTLHHTHVCSPKCAPEARNVEWKFIGQQIGTVENTQKVRVVCRDQKEKIERERDAFLKYEL